MKRIKIQGGPVPIWKEQNTAAANTMNTVELSKHVTLKHSDASESDSTITIVHYSLPNTLMSLANRLIDVLNPKHRHDASILAKFAAHLPISRCYVV